MNNRTEKLKIFVTKELKKICPNVCYEQATGSTPFPYVVYTLDHKRNELGYSYDLEVNVWDKNTSTKQVESIADSLEMVLDDSYFNEDTFALTIDLNTRNNLEDTDKSLKRRRILFNLEYFN